MSALRARLLEWSSRHRIRRTTLTTGFPSLDRALAGGIPRGTLTEAYGDPSVGKTSLALSCAAAAKTTLYFDLESGLTQEAIRLRGVNEEKLWMVRLACGEELLALCEELVAPGLIDFLVIDTAAALSVSEEQKPSYEKYRIAYRRLAEAVRRGNAACLVLNQTRWFREEYTPGGKALQQSVGLRLHMQNLGLLHRRYQPVGRRVRITALPTDAPLLRSHADLDLFFRTGFRAAADLVDLGVLERHVDRRGPWFYYGSLRLGRSRDEACAFLEQHPETMAGLDKDLRKEVA